MGDYSVEGFEHIVTIDRKRSMGEIANNLSEARWPGFLERMKQVQHPYIVFEFPLDDVLSFPVNSGIPKRIWPKLKANPNFLLSSIVKLSLMGIHTIFAGDRDNAEKIALKILQKVVDGF